LHRGVEEELLKAIKEGLADALVEAKVWRPQRIEVRVKAEKLIEAARFLRDKLGFDHIAAVTGVDYPEKRMIEVIYHVWSTGRMVMLALKTEASRDKPSLPSLVNVWEGALYHERETHEMLGVNFEGHPNLSLLLLPEDWDWSSKGYPLRKDFVLKEE